MDRSGDESVEGILGSGARMADSKSRWLTVWAAVGALATVGGGLATVLVAGASDDKQVVLQRDDSAKPTTVTITTTETTTTTTLSKTTESSPSDTDTTTRTKTQSTSTLAEQEERLRKKLTGVFTSCEPRRNLNLAVDTVAALDCATATAGPSTKPLVIQFADASNMSDFYSKERQGVDWNGNCAQGQEYFGTWHGGDGNVAGKSVCTQGSSRFRIYWGHDRENIGIIAEGGNAFLLFQWWSAYGSHAVG